MNKYRNSKALGQVMPVSETKLITASKRCVSCNKLLFPRFKRYANTPLATADNSPATQPLLGDVDGRGAGLLTMLPGFASLNSGFGPLWARASMLLGLWQLGLAIWIMTIPIGQRCV